MTKLVSVPWGINTNKEVVDIECYINADGHYIINCSREKLKEIYLKEGVQKLWCCSNSLEEIALPKSIEEANIEDNKIVNIFIPEGSKLKVINCYNNRLKKLIIPEGVERVVCYGNPDIEELYIPKSLKYIYSDNVPMTGFVEECNDMDIVSLDEEPIRARTALRDFQRGHIPKRGKRSLNG